MVGIGSNNATAFGLLDHLERRPSLPGLELVRAEETPSAAGQSSVWDRERARELVNRSFGAAQPLSDILDDEIRVLQHVAVDLRVRHQTGVARVFRPRGCARGAPM